MDVILNVIMSIVTAACVVGIVASVLITMGILVLFAIYALLAWFVIDPTDCYQCPLGEGSLQCETCRIHKWKQKHGGNK